MLLKVISPVRRILAMNREEIAFLRDLGFRVRERRVARNWTQEELARRCGLHRTYIGSVERGERNVSALNLLRLAKCLRISVSDLFST
jgi:transcriptional regulator with XRE-family HTH domain